MSPLKKFLLLLCLSMPVPNWACNLSDLTLVSATVTGADYDLIVTLCIGGGRTGVIFGADAPTNSALGFHIFYPNSAIAAPGILTFWTPSVTSDTLGVTFFGSQEGPGCGVGEVDNIIYQDAICQCLDYTCISSTANCGNVHQDCKNFHFTWTGGFIPDSIRASGVEAVFCAGCPGPDMMLHTGCPVPAPMNDTICPGDTALFQATLPGGGTVYWEESTDGGSTWTALTNGGNYSGVTTADLRVANGTNGHQYRYIYQDLPCTGVGGPAILVISNPAPPVITQAGNTLNASGGTVIQWFLNGSPVAGATSSSFIPSTSGSYTVLASVNGCELMSQPFSFVLNQIWLGADSWLSWGPSPADQWLQFTFSGPSEGLLSLWDATGKRVVEKVIKTGEKEAIIPVSGLLNGLYFWQFKDPSGREANGKVLIQR